MNQLPPLKITGPILSIPVLLLSIDYWVPGGVALGVLYILAVVSTIPFQCRRLTLASSVMAGMMLGIGYWISPEGLEPWKGQLNRILSLGVLYGTTWIVLCLNRQNGELQNLQTTLEQLAVERTRPDPELNDSRCQDHQAVERTKQGILNLERLFNKILEHAGALIYVKDPEGRYLLINRHYEKIIGKKNQDIKGKTSYDLFPHEVADTFQQNDLRVLHAKHPLYMEEVIMLEDGPHTYLSVKFPLYDDGGQRFGICGISTDITDLKRHEVQLRTLSHRFRLATESARIGIWEWDVEANMLICDEMMYSLYGIEKTNRLPLYEEWLGLVHPDDRKRTHEEIHLALQGQHDFGTTFRIIWPDGSLHWIEAHALVERDRDGKPVRMVGVNWDITERKRQYEANERLLLESASEGIWGLDCGGLTTFVNPAAARMLGYEPPELIGQPIYEMVRGCQQVGVHSAPCSSCSIADSFNGGEIQKNREETFRRKDGSWFPVEYTSTPMKDGKGKVVGAVVIFSDVTKVKLAELEKRDRERWARLEHGVARAIMQHSTLTDILQACAILIHGDLDDVCCRIWTYSERQNELVLKASAGEIVQYDGAREGESFGKAIIADIIREGKPYLINRVIGDHGIRRQERVKGEGVVTFAGYPLLIGSKRLGCLEILAPYELSPGLLTDLERTAGYIAIGIERLWAMQEIELGHWENEKILTTLTGILIGVNAHDQIIRWNSTAEEVFGVSAKEVLQKRLMELDLQLEWDHISRAIFEAKVRNKTIQLEPMTVRRRDGSVRRLDLSIAPMASKTPGPETHEEGFLILGTDITEINQLEIQLALAQKMESIGQLAAGIAHEINTPIQFISDNLRFLQEGFTALEEVLKAAQVCCVPDPAGPESDRLASLAGAIQMGDLDYLSREIPQALAQSLEGAERVAKIVRAMKEFSHPGSEEKKLVDVNHALETTITVARNEWKYVAEVERRFDPTLPLVPGLPGELNQVFLNLLVNAAQAIGEIIRPNSGERRRITVSTQGEAGWVEIRIADEGPGIPETIRHRIFEPFFTTKEVGKGTGQGLAIAHDVIVKKHGGHIAVQSKPGVGTSMIIRLPLDAAGGSSGNSADEYSDKKDDAETCYAGKFL